MRSPQRAEPPRVEDVAVPEALHRDGFGLQAATSADLYGST